MIANCRKYYEFVLIITATSLLSGCASGPEYQPPMEWDGTCTPAPKRATSRPYQINGIWYYPQQHYEYEEIGMASYYGGGDVFHGRPTATGERFDKNEVSAAHKTLPLPCIAEVTNLENGRQIQLKVNDRGPYIQGRILDVSRRTAQLLGFEQKGTARVKVRTLVPESLALNGIEASTMLVTKERKKIPEAETASQYARLPDNLFEESDDAIAQLVDEAPSIMTSTSTSSGIYVDVGEYESHNEAHAYSQDISNFENVQMEPIRTTRSKPYVIRLGPLDSMEHANQILDQLTQAGHVMSRIIIQR